MSIFCPMLSYFPFESNGLKSIVKWKIWRNTSWKRRLIKAIFRTILASHGNSDPFFICISLPLVLKLQYKVHEGGKIKSNFRAKVHCCWRPGLVTTISFWVSSDLDCSLYRWHLFVYFTFPWIWLDLRILLTNQVERNVK